MVSTVKCYNTDNFPVLTSSIQRGERLYQIRLYDECTVFRPESTGILRMKMLLGIIEAKAIVIDALIKTENSLQFLSVLCSSSASPLVFSSIMKNISKKIVIEEIEKKQADEFLSVTALKNSLNSHIPFSGIIQKISESRKVLVLLLLEYRALFAEYSHVLNESKPRNFQTRSISDFTIPFILFEHNGFVCALPEFMIDSVRDTENGKRVLEVTYMYGKREIEYDDILCIREMDLTRLHLKSKKIRGYYGASVPVTGGSFDFTLIVPSYL